MAAAAEPSPPPPAIGKHCMARLTRIPASVDLDRLAATATRARRVADACDLHVVNACGHQFEPQGATAVLVLRESHLSVHTYPEYRACYVDVFSCRVDFDHARLEAVLREVFETEGVDLTWVLR
jgi:S-adenosylmethionine decarboxylase proenzyme